MAVLENEGFRRFEGEKPVFLKTNFGIYKQPNAVRKYRSIYIESQIEEV